jgi:hypothetical protein
MLTSHSLIAQSDTIVVKVGDQQKKYTLHTKLLAYHWDTFMAHSPEISRRQNIVLSF